MGAAGVASVAAVSVIGGLSGETAWAIPAGAITAVLGVWGSIAVDRAWEARSKANEEKEAVEKAAARVLDVLRDVQELPAGESWAALLRPERGAVAFLGRSGELGVLREWCAARDQGVLRMVVGPGGVGKTRLALELSAEQRAAGWKCVESVAVGEEVRAIASALRLDRSTLLIVDYAETRPGLTGMLVEIARACAGGWFLVCVFY